MAILMGLTTLSGGIYWDRLYPSDPGVLTIRISRLLLGSRTTPTPGVQYPEDDEREAWTFDLDAIKEHAKPEVARGIPSWVGGAVTLKPKVEEEMLRFDITPEMLG